MSRSSRERVVQQPLGREETYDHDAIENDAPEEPIMEEESTQGSGKNQK